MKRRFAFVAFVSCFSIVLGIRVPQTPCPDVFNYYKDTRGRVYGVVEVPYDYATTLVFSVNASFLGNFNNLKLQLERVTTLDELNDGTANVLYNIYFPFTDVIPKITAVTYNDRVFCSGPSEAVIPGEPGITNIWSQASFKFTRKEQGFYMPDPKPTITDNDVPVKDPHVRPNGTPRPPTQPTPVRPIGTRRPPIPPTPIWPTPTRPTPSRVTPQIPARRPDDIDIPIRDPTLPVRPTEEPTDIDEGLIASLFTSPPTPSSVVMTPTDATTADLKCGVSYNERRKNEITPFILGGTDTDIGQYPWLVAFFTKKGSKYDYRCSANLISDSHVITAARCIQYYNFQVIKTEEIFLIMGTNNLEDWNRNGAITRKARRVDVHPTFKENSKTAHADLAIILMDRPVQFSKVLNPICLWKGDTDLYLLTDKMGVIAGFGQDEKSPQENLTNVFRAKRADMPIVSQEECLTGPLGFDAVTSDNTFCTRSGERLTGPCIGDSGAGFFISMDGAYYLRGIASAISVKNGICDLTKRYSVFCDVAKFLDWVKSHM